MVSIEQSASERILAERRRYVSGGIGDAAARRHRRGRRARHRRRRPDVRRLRGRDRVPEHRSPLRAGRRGDPPAGGRLPPPVLHGRRLRAVRRDVPPAGGALAVRGRRAEVDPRQLGRGGERERRQDRAGGDGPPGRRRLRQRLPRPDAPDDDDDEQGAPVSGGLRPVRPRGVPRAGAVPVPRRHERRRDRGAATALQDRGRPGDGRVRPARARAGRGRLPPDAPGLPRPPRRGVPRARDPLRRRRGAVRRRPDGAHVGDRALRRRRARPARLGQVDRRRPPARRGHGTRGAHGRRPARRARRDVRRQPALVRGGRRRARGGPRAGASSSAPRRVGRRAPRAPRRARRAARRDRRGARARPDARVRARRAEPDRAKAIVDAAFERGLLLLSCGLYGNVDPAPAPAHDLRRGARATDSALLDDALRPPLRERHAGHPDPRPRQALRRRDRGRRRRPRHRARRVLHDARPVRLGQDDDAADDRRLRAPRRGHDRARRARTSRGSRRTTGT